MNPARLAALVLAACLGSTVPGGAQTVDGVGDELLRAVLPAADRFDPATGDPPVRRAYRGGDLVGFVFHTEDVPPEPMGYSGPVQAVVGLALDGTITGVRVTDYTESYRSSMGDFLRRPGVQEQFAGKGVQDPFQVNGDVQRVTRATISTRALARGIRDGSRRVAVTYAGEMEVAEATGPVPLEELSWFDMQTRGILRRILIDSPDGHLDISLTHLPDDSVAAFFMGEDNVQRGHQQEERIGLSSSEWLYYALEGPRLRFFLDQGWSVAQEGDTIPLFPRQIYSFGRAQEGRVEGNAVLHGVFLLDARVDRDQPFSLLYSLEGHEGYYSVALDPLRPPETVAATADVPRASPTVEAGASEPEPPDSVEAAQPDLDSPADAEPPASLPDSTPDDEPSADPAEEAGPSAAPAEPSLDSTGPPSDTSAHSLDSAAEATPVAPGPLTDSALLPPGALQSSESSELARTLASTRWSRVAGMGAVVLLALVAFFLKLPWLRGVSLAATLVFLGFLDAGFLSVSHLTAAIWTGPSVFVRDLSLLILAVVTLVTTLVWGRVFCGFLCPFGALQDVLDRVVPDGWKLRVPEPLHRRGLGVKYGLLALVLVPALLGSRTSLYQYVEPFGTVFFPSRSFLLWLIAGAFLVGAVFVPRFYCRYACPLGAALAVVSFVAPGRIGRVEQCQVCRVCEQDCPTGAIRGPEIDFVECVRCNRCETNLVRTRGSCRHPMSEIRSRLVQIEVEAASGGDDRGGSHG